MNKQQLKTAGLGTLAIGAALYATLSNFTFSERGNILDDFDHNYEDQKFNFRGITALDRKINKLHTKGDKARTNKQINEDIMECSIERDQRADHYNLISDLSGYAFSSSDIRAKGYTPLPEKLEIKSYKNVMELMR